MAFSLGGCVDPILPSLYRDVERAFKQPPPLALTREDINRIPYASILVRVGKGPENMLILARYDGKDLHWVSTDFAVLVTRGGRLVRTVGFAQDLLETRFFGADPLSRVPQDPEAAMAPARRRIDIRPPDRYGVLVESRLRHLGDERIEIKELVLDTALYAESNRAGGLDWTFENHYWADRRTGVIWRSVQHAAPSLPPIDIRILKPAA